MSLSVWEKESFYAPCDVLIVGSGLLGLWTARELKIKRPTLKVTLIDRYVTPAGASTRNAGFVCFGSPSELLHDATLMGKEEMWKVVAMRYAGIQKIRQVFSDDTIGYDNCGGYECFETMDAAAWQAFEEQLHGLNNCMREITGEENVFQVSDEKLAAKGLQGFEHLVENRLEGGLHSGKLVQALLAKVQEAGVTVLNGLEVKSFHNSTHAIDVFTYQHINFSTQKLLFATNAFLSAQFPVLGIHPARGQIILSPAIRNLALSGTFHFDSGYYYFRNLGNRVLLGGARNTAFEDEATLAMENTSDILEALYAFIQQHIPAAAGFHLSTYESWSGIMAMHDSKKPVLKEMAPGVWAAMCCNGMGVALSPVFAETVAKTLIN